MSTAAKLMTAEDYCNLDDGGACTELVRGRIVSVNPPQRLHGYVCMNIGAVIRAHVRAQRLGRVFANDTGVITAHNPDTVRGADVAYVSYERLPAGPLPDGYLDIAPELIFEVLSPSDSLQEAQETAAEYLQAGVLVVCVVDPRQQKVHVYRSDNKAEVATVDQALVFPEVFGDFSVPVSEFFE